MSNEPTANAKQESEPADVPSVSEQQTLMSLVRTALNPEGKDPRVDEYITATFSYISGAFYKMATSTDKEATAKETAEDLNTRFENWVAEREKKKAEDEEQSQANGVSETDEKPTVDEKKE
ncbi:uncharacterized protein RJT20DRAFT_132889 [Scheffersomyces xylosifermentans]|uniref:uncharacterized protein n=1 Tax=Scheffersomyces xylosifermentans TaxID=1304137 RepID=UPI00315D95EF